MDTDDLSNETYRAVMITAEEFHHDLTLQFGLLSGDCDSDDDFLNKSEELVKDWLAEEDLRYVIEDIFFDDPPNKSDFKKVLLQILNNTASVKEIPAERRSFDY